MSENRFMSRVMLEAPRHGACLYRNNVGVFRGLYSERKIRCGLCVGSSDLIGWITLDGIAVFLAVETKSKRGQTRPEQLAFIDAVRRAGGLAFVIAEGEEFAAKLGKEIERWSANAATSSPRFTQ